MNKTLIEEGSAELLELFEKVSEEARSEKLAVPPINKINYWWTRKPLIVGRAIALAATLDSINDLKDLLNLKSEKRSYRSALNLKLYQSKVQHDTLKVLDPFAGAGNLLFEVKRMGLDCTALDYNPVAYLIEKASLEYPATSKSTLADDIKKYGEEAVKRTEKKMQYYYKNDENPILAYLWAWCIRCPYCNQRIPLLNHLWVARTNKKKIGIRLALTDDLDFKVEIIQNICAEEANKFTQKGGKAICLRCKNSISYKQLTASISSRKDKEILLVVKKCKFGKCYELPSSTLKKKFEDSSEILKTRWDELISSGSVSDDDVRASHRREHMLWHYGIRKWNQFYNERQLLTLANLSENIKEVCKEIADRDYAKVIATYLSFMLCKHANYNSYGTYWHTTGEKIGPVLAFRFPRLIYSFAEINPFEDVSGSLRYMLKDIVTGVRFATDSHPVKNIMNSSVLKMSFKDSTFDLVITDPPYLDDVQYGEFSDFFYSLIKGILYQYYPELPKSVILDEDISVSWGRFGTKKIAESFYRKSMGVAFREIARVLKDDGIAVIFFAHSSTEAWNMLLETLRDAKLRVTSSYALHTESTQNPIAQGKTSFMSSIVVACRKILGENEAYIEDLIPEMEDKVKALINTIDREKLILMPITDLIIMVYGEVLEIATRHSKIKSFDANFKPDFENLISQARESILREILTKILGKSPNLLGPEISFYTLARVFYRGHLKANDALKMTRAYGLEGGELEKGGIIAFDEGNMRLLSFVEVDLDVKPEEVKSGNLHQQLMYLEKVAAGEGANKVKNVVNYNNFRVGDLKQIILLLIKSYKVMHNKGEKLDEDEAREFRVLQAIADVLGIQDSGDTSNMDRFLEK